MIETFTAISHESDSRRAGSALGAQAREHFGGAAPDAVVLFASSRHDPGALLGALSAAAGTEVIVGASSAGEFTREARGEGRISLLALRSTDMQFAVGLGHHPSRDPAAAAAGVVQGFRGLRSTAMPYRAALVMTDALAGHTDAVVEELTLASGGNYGFFGGGAGDDARFQQTHVFAGTGAHTDAVVALEMLSTQPIGIGVAHGWVPAGPGLRVTEADGMRLISLNGAPAVEAFEAHAQANGQSLDRADPLPFFLHNILGIRTDGGHRLRVPLGVGADGSVLCAANIAAGAIVHIMQTDKASAVQAAEQATRAALAAIGERRPAAALVFDCVATRLRLGQAFGEELGACATLLGSAGFVGCNTYGQIARAEGQFGGFHNCTAVVCVLPG